MKCLINLTKNFGFNVFRSLTLAFRKHAYTFIITLTLTHE